MEEQLIAAIFRRPTLWDPSDKLRRNGKFVKTIWEEVAEEVSIDVKTAKSKWKNLRAYFASVHRGIMMDQPRSGSAEDKVPSTWVHYQQMLFIKDIVSPDESRGDSSFAAFQNISENQEDVAGKKLNTIQTPPTVGETIVTPSESTQNKYQVNQRKRSLGSDKNHVHTNDQAWLEIERRKIQILEKEAESEENDDMLFFKSLVPCMKHFSIAQKLRVRMAIQQIVLQEHEDSSRGPSVL